jgi:prophage DNA circulation protein
MSENMRFDAALPRPYKDSWQEAYRSEKSDAPRFSSYQAPNGEPIPFILKEFRFAGGQSKDTAEYPFGGLWSTERLNEKPQSLTVEGFLRGPAYIAQRNALIEALREKTDDETPGYVDFPFWGRFPVVVDTYEVGENTDEQGQCAVSLTLIRAGVSIADRLADMRQNTTAALQTAKAQIEAAAVQNFVETLFDTADTDTLKNGFGKLKDTLLNIVGSVQGATDKLNAMTDKIVNIERLIAQGIRSPRDLAAALVNAVGAIAGGLAEIKNSFELYLSDDTGTSDSGNASNGAIAGGSSGSLYSVTLSDNEKNVLLRFFSASEYTLDIHVATVHQQATKAAIENLYRTAAFSASAQIMAGLESPAYQKTLNYWALLEKLEKSIDKENPAVYTALTDLRIAVSRELAARDLSAELARHFTVSMPLLFLAQYLGCDEDKLRNLNRIADSFVIEGDVIYV